MKPVAIVGAGVAGSILAHLAFRRGLNGCSLNVVYDLADVYRKPCGESIPAWIVDKFLPLYSVEPPSIVAAVKRFNFIGYNVGIMRIFESSEVVWYIIDKSSWINRLRRWFSRVFIRNAVSDISKLCSENKLVVDARGPLASEGTKVVVWRSYVENNIGISDEVFIVFAWDKVKGIGWVFPYGDLLNVGGGFIGLSNPKDYTLRVLERVIGKSPRLVSESYSLVTVIPKVSLVARPCTVRVGEAAGLVMALGGEGIRPAIISAINLYSSIVETSNCDHKSIIVKYKRKTKDLVNAVKLQRRVLSVALHFSEKTLHKIVKRAPDYAVEKWLKGLLDSYKLIFSILLH